MARQNVVIIELYFVLAYGFCLLFHDKGTLPYVILMSSLSIAEV